MSAKRARNLTAGVNGEFVASGGAQGRARYAAITG
jgi:hypothetical protein